MAKGIKVLLFIAIGLVGLGLVAVGIGLLLGGFRRVPVEKKAVTVEEPFGSVVLDEISADVHLARAEDGVCRLEYAQVEGLELEVTVKNGTLSITRRDTRPWYQKLGLTTLRGFGKTTLYLPDKAYAMLSVATVTGDLIVDGGFRAESFCASVVTGDIRIDDLQAGDATLYTVTGDFHLRGVVAARTLRISCTTGDITLTGCDAGELVEIENTTGSIEAELRSPKRYSAHTTTGSVRVPASVDGAAECRASCVTGSITITVAP